MAYKFPTPLSITTTQFDVLVGGSGNTIANVGPGTSNQLLQSGGNAANPTYSTATYPPTATGTGTILRADGTNWSATTATYPTTAGTSGNLLTSDGTNWTSSAPPAAGLGYTLALVNRDDSSDPADGITYFMCTNQFIQFTASGNAATRLYVPKAGTATKVYGAITVGGTLGSTENSTLSLRLNNTTDTTISNALKLSTASNAFNATISVAVVAGDYFEFKFVSASWATNPLNVCFSGTIYIS